MLQITPQHRLLLAVKPVDFRKGIDGLAALCRQILNDDPFSGAIFVFTNRSHKSIKALVYDGQGFWLCTKRFSRGKLSWWPTCQEDIYSITASQLNILLHQGRVDKIYIPSDWRTVTPQAACIKARSVS